MTASSVCVDSAVRGGAVNGEGLTEREISAFAAVFHDRDAATDLLAAVRFPLADLPSSAPTPRLFWSAISRELRAGALVDGRRKLLTAARERYPNNSAFDGIATAAAVGGATPSGPVVWNLPGRLPRFVGRDGLLADLHAKLTADARVALVALDGMGGVGKSAAALEYAHRHAAEFDVAWWVPAERAELVGQHLAGLAKALGLPPGSDPASIWIALRRVASWLVIFDNVEDVGAVAPFQPGEGGRVLVTSRLRSVRGLGRALPVPLLDRDASVALLQERVSGLDRAVAGQLAAAVGDLPFAVEQAAGYLDETDTPGRRLLLRHVWDRSARPRWQSSLARRARTDRGRH